MGASRAERKRVRAVEFTMECLALIDLDRKMSEKRRQILARIEAYVRHIDVLLQDPEVIAEIEKLKAKRKVADAARPSA